MKTALLKLLHLPIKKSLYKSNFFKVLLCGFIFSISLEKLYVPFLPLHLNIIYLIALLISCLFFISDIKRDHKSDTLKYIICLLFYCFFSSIFFYFYTSEEVFSRLPKDFGLRGSPLRGLYVLIQNFLLILVSYVTFRCLNYASRALIKKIILINICFLLIVLLYEFFGRNFFSIEVPFLRTEGFWYQSSSRTSYFYRLWGSFDEPATLARFCGIIYFFVFNFYVFAGLTKIKKDILLFSLLIIFSFLGLIFSASLSIVISLIFSIFFMFVYSFLYESRRKILALTKASFVFFTPLFFVIFLISGSIFLGKVNSNLDSINISESTSSSRNQLTQTDLEFKTLESAKDESIFKFEKYNGIYQFTNIPVPTEASGSQMRIVGIMRSINEIIKAPFFGVGFGNMPFYTYMPEVSIFSFGSFNLLLSSILELGLIGFALLVIVFLKIFTLKDTSYSNPPLLKTLKFTLMLSLIFEITYGSYNFSVIDMVLIGSIFAFKYKP